MAIKRRPQHGGNHEIRCDVDVERQMVNVRMIISGEQVGWIEFKEPELERLIDVIKNQIVILKALKLAQDKGVQ